MADYEAISKAVSNAVKREVDKQIKAAYEHGYQRGYSEEYEARQSAVDIAYKRGLNDAWKCAKKINNMTMNKSEKIFGEYRYLGTIAHNLTASEAIAKIKEYEEKQTEIHWQTEIHCETCECFGDITECEKRPCYSHSCWTPKKIEKSYRNNKYYNTFPTSKETADEIKAEYDEETRSYIYTVEGEEE